jgi:peptidoglycan/LPS O-acetylase OafA/YrhL
MTMIATPSRDTASEARPPTDGGVKRTAQLPYADFFRALAIFYVFLGHAGGFAHEPALTHHIALTDAVSLFDGVAMLFCLSGFLLAAPLLRAYLDTPHDLPLIRPFYYARVLRIYPLYAAAVIVIAVALAIAGNAPTLGDVALHLAMLQNFSPATIQSLAGPLWTMPIDAQFYLLLPLAFALLARAYGHRAPRARVVALYAVLGAIVAASIAYRFVIVWHWAPVGLDQQLFLVDQLPGMASLFALGVAARLTVIASERDLIPLRFTSNLALGLIAVAILARVVQYGSHGAWLHLAGAGHMRPALFASIDETAGGIGCVCLLLAADSVRSGWFARFVASPWVAFAAAISYAFYLLHFTVLTGLAAFVRGGGMHALVLMIGIALLALVPLCALAHHAIEKPFLDRKARLRRFRDVGV